MKKKIQFPNIKKHMQNFLTDESGKISKHNALGFGIVGAALSMIDGVDAHHCDTTAFKGTGHTNNWDGGTPGRYWERSRTCRHLSNMWNAMRPVNKSYSLFNETFDANKGDDPGGIGTMPGYNCNLSINNNNRTVGTVTDYHKNCGYTNSNVKGHISRIGTSDEASAAHTSRHTNTHNNY